MTDFPKSPGGVDPWLEPVFEKVGKKVARLLKSRTEKPLTWLLNDIIRDALYRPERGTYIHVSDTPFTPGRNSDWAEMAASADAILGCDPLGALTYFTNELRSLTPTIEEDGSQTEKRPSERISAGDHHVFTFEFDVSLIDYLLVQFGWVMPRKNNLDCPMGDMYRVCSRYSDFVGISVVWSGSKSLHIHVVFSTMQAQALFGIKSRSSEELRCGFMELWLRLHELFVNTIDTLGYSADQKLKHPEQLRRLPGGTRVIDKENLLGIAIGTEVRQIVVWEHRRLRADGDELPLFMTPDVFAPKARPVRRFVAPCASKVGRMTLEEERYCSAKLAELYQGWPRFAHLAFEGQRYVAKFYNSECDRIPSSLMREDHTHILVLGRDAGRIVR